MLPVSGRILNSWVKYASEMIGMRNKQKLINRNIDTVAGTVVLFIVGTRYPKSIQLTIIHNGIDRVRPDFFWKMGTSQ